MCESKGVRGVVMSDAVCDISVSVWQRNGRTIYLMGSDASDQSAKIAGDLVKETHPHAVFVELDLKSVLLGLVGGIYFATSKTPLSTIKPKSKAATMNSRERRRLESDEASQTIAIMEKENILPGIPNQSVIFGVREEDKQPIMTDLGPLPLAGLPPQKVLVPTSQVVRSNDNNNNNNNKSTATITATPKKPLTFRHPVLPPLGMDLDRWNYLNERIFHGANGTKTDNAHPRSNAFVNAMKEALRLDAFIVLGDRDAEITRRETDLAWAATPTWSGLTADELRIINKCLASDHDGTDNAKDLARRKVRLLKRNAPLVYQAVLDERDEYMAVGLDSLRQFPSVVAITGTTHLVGVARHLLDLGWKPVPKSCPAK